ncbi:hypothetical protein [Poseidonibacter lekithochrous]|uniref:hypothetical protein n=1 Tax=Poseidonibacter lekithochrous TaxID=1904463 RepID=UPI000D3AF86F|nr:hypothetical protein [Poseidonibacter lekithochrous]
MIDNLTILTLIVFISNVLLYIQYKKVNLLILEFKSLKNEHLNLEKAYNVNINKVNSKFNAVYKKLNTIPIVDSKIDNKIAKLIKEEKIKLEQYVLDSFKRLDKDILFESKIDEYYSKTISLQEILSNEKDTYSKKFENLFNSVQIFNNSVVESKKTIEKINSDINKKLVGIKDTENQYLEYYRNGIKSRESILKRIDILEKFKKKKESISSNSDSKSDTDTFSDDNFKVKNELTHSLSDLQMDEPVEDLEYKRRYK